MSKKASYEVLDPPVDVVIEHESRGEQKSVACLARDHRHQRVEVRFPMSGTYAFSLTTGEGQGHATGWHLALASLRELRGEPDYCPVRVLQRSSKRTAKPTPATTVPANSALQKELFR
jgi:hypothetical protein